MQLLHTPAALSASFDEPNLLVSAGLVPAVRLAEKVGLPDLAAEYLSVTGRLFTGIKAPSTLGTFLRGFTFGHVRQLDAVASRALLGWVEQARLLPGLDQGAVIDIDDTVKAVYGPGKQGAQFGYTKIRGLNAQLATISTAQAAPVIAATRLRRGAAHSATGAVRMLRDTIATARRAGACGPILVRADSAYCRSTVVRAVQAAGADFSVGMPLNSAVLRAIDTPKSSTPRSRLARPASRSPPG